MGLILLTSKTLVLPFSQAWSVASSSGAGSSGSDVGRETSGRLGESGLGKFLLLKSYE